jgi:hypothetical protein
VSAARSYRYCAICLSPKWSLVKSSRSSQSSIPLSNELELLHNMPKPKQLDKLSLRRTPSKHIMRFSTRSSPPAPEKRTLPTSFDDYVSVTPLDIGAIGLSHSERTARLRSWSGNRRTNRLGVWDCRLLLLLGRTLLQRYKPTWNDLILSQRMSCFIRLNVRKSISIPPRHSWQKLPGV